MVQGHLLLEEAARLQRLGEARGHQGQGGRLLLLLIEHLRVRGVQGDQAQAGVLVLGEEGHGHAVPALQHGLRGVALKCEVGRREIFLLSGKYFYFLTEDIFAI